MKINVLNKSLQRFTKAFFKQTSVTHCSLFTAGAVTPSPPLLTTALQVAEVTQNSVRLVWNPLPGVTEYILRWGVELGESFFFYKFDIYLRLWLYGLTVLTLIRYWAGCFCQAACCNHLLSGDRSASGPSISLCCPAHIFKRIRSREFCR